MNRASQAVLRDKREEEAGLSFDAALERYCRTVEWTAIKYLRYTPSGFNVVWQRKAAFFQIRINYEVQRLRSFRQPQIYNMGFIYAHVCKHTGDIHEIWEGSRVYIPSGHIFRKANSFFYRVIKAHRLFPLNEMIE